MHTQVPSNEMVTFQKFHNISDYFYKSTTWKNTNGIPTALVNNNVFTQINNDKRKCIVVYCKTNFVDEFFQLLKTHKKIIFITGGSDTPVTSSLYSKKPKCIVKWYAENVDCIYNDLYPIPMGSISATWIGDKEDAECNDHPEYVKMDTSNVPKSLPIDLTTSPLVFTPLVFMCFSLGTNISHRTNMYNKFKNLDFVTNMCANHTGQYLKDDDFMRNVYNHKFVLSPYGNGLDCGRTWMALQLGTIPIVPYRESMVKLFDGLPVLMLKDDQPVTIEFLINFAKDTDAKIKSGVLTYNKLSIKHWKSLIEEYRETISLSVQH